MISAISWIPKGVAKSTPVEVEPPSKEEIEELLKSGALDRSGDSDEENEDEDMDLDVSNRASEIAQALAAAKALDSSFAGTSAGPKDITDALRELDMDHYDEEDDGIELFSAGLGDTYYASNDMDPYLKDKDDDDDEEIEDMTIKPSDAVIVCACNEDNVSQLQVCVFEELEDGDFNLYSHHDIILPAFPLCTAWLDCNLKGGDKGNFIAIGSMEPAIEIWDLDLVDEVQPFMVLGGVAKEKKKGKKACHNHLPLLIKSVKYQKDSHTDSVLGLAWNKEVRNYLASASADKSVKIWDVVTGKCLHTIEHHTDKVQAVAWNRHSPNDIISGSFDHSVVKMDIRDPSRVSVRSAVTADVESLAWDPHEGNSFVVSLEDGTVQGFDVRGASSDGYKPLFTLHAHDKAVCSVAYNPAAPNLLATGSTDKMVKLWDLSNNQPSCIASKNPKAGAVFQISFSEDIPFLLAMGGSKGKLQVWDTLVEPRVNRKFKKYSSRKVDPLPDEDPDPIPKD